MIILLSQRIKDLNNFTIISKKISFIKLLDYITANSVNGIIMDTEFPMAKELVAEIKKRNEFFPLIVWGEDFDNYPRLNPFHCVDNLDEQTIKNVTQLSNNYKKKVETFTSQLNQLALKKEITIKDQVQMGELQSYLKSAVWNYKEIEIPNAIGKSLDKMLDLAKKMLNDSNQ